MKKLFVALSALMVLIGSSCNQTPQGNVNTKAPGVKDELPDEPVTITAEFVNSNPPELVIKLDKDPVHIMKEQKISWNIQYPENGTSQIIHVTIANFKNKQEQEVDLFQDGSKYEFKNLSPNQPVTPKTTGAAKPDNEMLFKYKIIFTVEGKFKTTLDPRVVIDSGLGH